MENELLSKQRHLTAKAAHKKLIKTIAQKGKVITVEDVKASFYAKEESKLQKVEAFA